MCHLGRYSLANLSFHLVFGFNRSLSLNYCQRICFCLLSRSSFIVSIVSCFLKVTKYQIIYSFFKLRIVLITVHFYAGGSPLVYGIINNIEHTALYFIILLRSVSQKFRKESNPWFKKFHILITVSCNFFSLLASKKCYFLNFADRSDAFGYNIFYTTGN